jgi:predicted RNA methylase
MKDLHLAIVLLAAKRVLGLDLDVDMDDVLDARLEYIVGEISPWRLRALPFRTAEMKEK